MIDRIVMLPDVLYNYFMNSSSVTHTVNIKNFQPSYILFNYVYDFIETEEVSKDKIFDGVIQCYRERLVSDVICAWSFNVSNKEKIKILRYLRRGSKKLFSNRKTKLTFGRKLIYVALKLKLYYAACVLARFANRNIKTN